ncbi:hypothetical protein KJ636_03515 [Patescibacteria group bacterium]|nr:hypothetical protein [Patescibacteria group bacterium]MBU4481010.1 hypothetical protein [Patescibacteria group bacterium]
MKKKRITIEDLARMVQKGFLETANGFLETAKKDEVNGRFDEVSIRFDKVEDRLERIEKLILADHKKRIEKLEFEVKELKELLAVK